MFPVTSPRKPSLQLHRTQAEGDLLAPNCGSRLPACCWRKVAGGGPTGLVPISQLVSQSPPGTVQAELGVSALSRADSGLARSSAGGRGLGSTPCSSPLGSGPQPPAETVLQEPALGPASSWGVREHSGYASHPIPAPCSCVLWGHPRPQAGCCPPPPAPPSAVAPPPLWLLPHCGSSPCPRGPL